MVKMSSVKLLSLLVLAFLVKPDPAGALRILGLFPLPAHSHYLMFKSLTEGLAERGHEVVIFSPFPEKDKKTPRANLTLVDTSMGRPSMTSTYSFDLITFSPMSLPGVATYQAMQIIAAHGGNSLCEDVFGMPEFQRVMNGGFGRFDLVLTEVFGSDCWAVVPYKLGLPFIAVSSAPDVSWMHDRIGSIDNPSYINNVFTNLHGRMSLWERLVNTATGMLTNYFHRTLMEDGSDAVVRKYFGPDVPPLRDLVKNTSLVLLNRHISIHAARPVVPNLVHVGGLHIKPPPGTLDPSVRRWMDEAEHGVVFFSLGSLIRAATMPTRVRDAMLAAFAELPQRVVWKYEDEGLELPPNVRTYKWLSQMDILTHNKTVLFMTHGGLMGTLEALHSSVPMLGMPLFADQMSNIKLYTALGIAESLEVSTLTKDSVLTKIRTMTTNPRYRERAREVATLFRDRPRSAMDEAVWWVEYVVRNHGAPHLRPLGADMPLYQYLLLDVIALAAAMATVVVVLVTWAVRRVLCAPGSASTSNSSKRKVA